MTVGRFINVVDLICLTFKLFERNKNVSNRDLRLLGTAELLFCVVEAIHGAHLRSVVNVLCTGHMSLSTCKIVISVLLCTVESSQCLLNVILGLGNLLVDLPGAEIRFSREL